LYRISRSVYTTLKAMTLTALILCLAVRLPTKHCCVYFKWRAASGTVTVSIYIGCILALEMQHRKTLMFSQRLVDSNRSTGSHIPEYWTVHRQR